MKNIEELREGLERLPIPFGGTDTEYQLHGLLEGFLGVLEAQQKEIEELKDTVAYHAGVLKGIQNQEMRRHGWN